MLSEQQAGSWHGNKRGPPQTETQTAEPTLTQKSCLKLETNLQLLIILVVGVQSLIPGETPAEQNSEAAFGLGSAAGDPPPPPPLQSISHQHRQIMFMFWKEEFCICGTRKAEDANKQTTSDFSTAVFRGPAPVRAPPLYLFS